MKVTERMVDVGEVTLSVAEAGEGGTPLMLVHGWTGAKEDFTDWLESFARAGYHVVAPDLRGHGSSTKTGEESDYLFDRFVDDLMGLAAALAWKRFCLVGHSMGGMLAQVLACREPEALAGLVLMNTHHGPLEGQDEIAAAGVEAARTAGTEAIADLMAVATEPGPLETEAYRRVCAERPGYFERGIDNTRRSCSAMFAACLLQMTDSESRLEDLALLAVPTLVIVGEQDAPFLESSRSIAGAVPGASLVVIPDAGHSPQAEAPGPWWDAISGFLADVSLAVSDP